MTKPTSSILVPTVIEKSSMGERAYDIYSRLLKDRIVFMGTEVNDTSANLVIAQLLHLAHEDHKKEIFMYINSPGGSVYDGLAILDTMRYISPPVVTIGIGMTASMGAVLLGAGEKGRRFALPHAKVMIHQPSHGYRGSASDIEISAKETLKVKDTLETLIAEFTGKSKKAINKDMDRDFFMTADEAVKYGLIDGVITKASQVK